MATLLRSLNKNLTLTLPMRSIKIEQVYKELRVTLTVLSLFDGMSCGQIAISQLTSDYIYFASEIDKYAMEIAQKNFPNTKQLGDITNVISERLPKIDLLIGGSPCQSFSFAGKQLNFDDTRSNLFFEYVRVLEETNPKYFLFENVNMKKESRDIISHYLGCEPIEINSNLVSAQNRKRLYWTNIPFNGIVESNVQIKDIVDFNGVVEDKYYLSEARISHRKSKETAKKFRTTPYLTATLPKCPTLTKRYHKMGNTDPMVMDSRGPRKLTPQECEALQTVPLGYTEGVSNTQRYAMLGNGWTVEVIRQLLSGII